MQKPDNNRLNDSRDENQSHSFCLPIRPISSIRVKTLLRQISEMDTKSDHVALFEILHRHTESYSVNTNGVFCPMSILSPEVVDDMIIYVENARRRKMFERETDADMIIYNQQNRDR